MTIAIRLLDSIAKNYVMYEMVQRAHIRNRLYIYHGSFRSKKLSTTHLSEIMSKKSRGEIFRLSSKLKDSLEQRDGYVGGTDMKEKSQRKGIAKRLDCFRISLFINA